MTTEVDENSNPSMSAASLRREEIAAHATRLFAERGYDATSIEDISQAAGIGRGLLYHYFKSKDEILRLIHKNIFRPLTAECRRIYAEGGPPDQVLASLSRTFLRTMSANPAESVVWARETRALQSNTEYWNEIKSTRQEFRQILETTISRGIDQGIFREVDRRAAVFAWINLHEHSYTWLKIGGRLTADEVSENFMSIFLNGVAARPTANVSNLIPKG